MHNLGCDMTLIEQASVTFGAARTSVLRVSFHSVLLDLVRDKKQTKQTRQSGSRTLLVFVDNDYLPLVVTSVIAALSAN
eukprot:scaffold34913_cov172-Amphora_coffeaeformis.AAC.3